ncbi:30S ribosomal protein S18 [Mycoplasmopsis columbina]|uniref:Small ribosomal subunit protein bS18 n=1 Tax=Mycoplasmopsis columbina SF7 TaxID=1037410 RepID=F9UKF2_9BACT|nr:30S ribosomal protein S18 [Mycoplasmopsis columbina]EGV00157.1 30S ribosomal protein s18 [Mycoplasmopsis columbina SF7]VEU77050.1 30S ribosomal protein S18 [Mycoplasmopsis columbina]
MFKKNSKKSGYNKRRKCVLCEQKINYVDFKDVETLNKFVSGTGQIKPRSVSGACAKDQRKIATAIKRARFMALMPYAKERVRVVKSATTTTTPSNN